MENKTGDLERWEVSADELISYVVSFKVIAIRPLIFVYLKFQYVDYSMNPKDIIRDNHKKEM